MIKIIKPIYVVIGTRAQLIKTAPLLIEMDRVGLKYSFIYTAQHRETISEIINNFGIKQPDYTVRVGQEAKTITLFGKWLLRILTLLVFENKKIISTPGLLITHGDTITSVWGAILGKLTGCKVMHIESGLRSFNWFKPFPEEISRLIIFRLTDIFVCPNRWAVNNIRHYNKIIINTKFNTLYDSVQLALKNKSNYILKYKKPYVIVSIHRFEHIFNRTNLSKIINIISMISQTIPCVFVLHPATKNKLEKYNVIKALQKNKNIHIIKRQSFFNFIKLISNSEFVITDGGSNQEELSYIGKPTLILRNVTERIEGIGQNAVLSQFNLKIIKNFLHNYNKYNTPAIITNVSPSKIIVDWIRNLYEIK